MSNFGYPETPWFDPRLELRDSPVHGRGVFATAPIRAGEVLQVVGGTVVTTSQGRRGPIRPCRCGTPACRGRVTGQDWRRPELHERYRGDFPPYLQRRIDAAP